MIKSRRDLFWWFPSEQQRGSPILTAIEKTNAFGYATTISRLLKTAIVIPFTVGINSNDITCARDGQRHAAISHSSTLHGRRNFIVYSTSATHIFSTYLNYQPHQL
jgi:hypothetical protein